jgi:hypothetical protein
VASFRISDTGIRIYRSRIRIRVCGAGRHRCVLDEDPNSDTVSDPASEPEPDRGLDHDVKWCVALMRQIVLN